MHGNRVIHYFEGKEIKSKNPSIEIKIISRVFEQLVTTDN